MGPSGLAETLEGNRREGRGSLLVYFMVDVARRPAWPSLARACREAGATGVEVGFPFSDPIADGPVLQAAASRALEHGTHWGDLLHALRAISRELPVAVMSYANPVHHRGLPQACTEIAAAGGSALIVPDLALEESGPWRVAARGAGLSLVQMASPATPAVRIQRLVRASSAFLYLVSRYGTTGHGRRAPGADLRGLVHAAHATRSDLPVLVGFGVRTPADARLVQDSDADGAIVGTAIEELLARGTDPVRLKRFVAPIARAVGSSRTDR
jgi:tryptophan synthase alpha chain